MTALWCCGGGSHRAPLVRRAAGAIVSIALRRLVLLVVVVIQTEQAPEKGIHDASAGASPLATTGLFPRQRGFLSSSQPKIGRPPSPSLDNE
jgi:hypothetical protein